MSRADRLAGVRGVTLDFGNTLVAVDRSALRGVVEATARSASTALDLGDPGAFLRTWNEERDRQFREEVPLMREVDLAQRAVRVLARLRGMAAPSPARRWDDVAATGHSTVAEIEGVIASYSTAFVENVPVPDASGRVIAGLADRGFTVAILSNWPLAATIDRFVEAAGWRPMLAGIFVSQRIGTIKPDPAIFAHVVSALGIPPAALLHVGDDWAADVVGAVEAGWRAAYLRDRQGDTPLPTSARDGNVAPDIELDSLDDLGAYLEDPAPVDSADGAP